ncbi:hypothetical protein P3T35_003140 [Kitasatospora sp. GP30]|uniref:hypothetical protein n=1 Tax=Kitasatospora sp. GP30 TaxID=3035084 RepID=UPI000C705AEE|nr:hypothetical protein [Kitasatospora sp. GP30]MDH6141127.1 hypothetical protein [Kitasatospora sp. GP30]
MRRTITAIRRLAAVARQIHIDLRHAVFGLGNLIRTGDMLERLGIQLPDGQQSWYGRHVAKAYRAAHDGQDAPKAWAQHRTTGRWIRVFVYSPTDPALLAGLRSYKATTDLVTRASFAEAA